MRRPARAFDRYSARALCRVILEIKEGSIGGCLQPKGIAADAPGSLRRQVLRCRDDRLDAAAEIETRTAPIERRHRTMPWHLQGARKLRLLVLFLLVRSRRS